MINSNWQLQEAKNKLSMVVDKAKKEGPQFVTRHGKKEIVILSVTEYEKLIKPEMDLVAFFQNSPLADEDLDLDRSTELPRDIEL